jgi:hypothetical protein
MRVVLGHEITRSGKAAAEPIGVDFKAPNELTLPISSKPDPRLVALVRILARQAAQDFIQAVWDGPGEVGLSLLFDAKDDWIAPQRSVKPTIPRNLLPFTKEYAITAVRQPSPCRPQLVAGDLNLRN